MSNMRPQFSVVRTTTAPVPPTKPARNRLGPAIVAGSVLLALGAALSWSLARQVERLLGSLDAHALDQAANVLTRSIEQQRRVLVSEVGVLADDTRVRASVMTPDFSEATVKDTLTDLRAASGASILAVLDLGGKVRAVVGADWLRNIDLGSSPLVKQASSKPAAQVWTFREQMLVVGAAPIHVGANASALFMMAFELGGQTLGALRDMTGVDAAVLIGDRVVASTSRDARVEAAFKHASAMEDLGNVVSVADGFVARHARVGQTAGTGSLVLVLPRHHDRERAGLLRPMVWGPAFLGALTFVLVIALVRRTAWGDRP